MRPLSERLQEALGGSYEIGEELSGGGMSRLFLAVDLALGRRVVVKVLPEERLFGLSPDRFQREIRVTAALSHANIVGILATGIMDGVPFYIMPFVEGRSLRALLDESGRLPIREAVSILRDVARACAFAHSKGIIHRDIKPGNVLLAGGAAVITDFGVAKAVAQSAEPVSGDDSTLTRAGFTIGTPAYMAPEQAAGERDIDARADLYSLGVMAYEMITGRVPFEGKTPRELLTAQLTERPQPVAQLRPDVPPGLADLIQRCLAKDPKDRPASADAVLAALDELPVTGGSHPSLAAVMARSRWLRRGLAAVAVLLVALLGIRLAIARNDNTAASPTTSLAVLPFVSRSADSTDAYLAQGLTDALSAALARDPTVRVASRLATAEYAERTAPPAEIGRALKVAALLDGSVQRQGDRIRVTVQLVDSRSGSALWSDSYDRQSGDLLQVQADIAQSIVDALQRRLGAKVEGARGVASGFHVAEAYDRYLQGRYAFGQRGETRLREAIGHFEAAAALDTAAARAYSGLADTYVLLPVYATGAEGLTPDSALALALSYANRAVELDSNSAEVLASRGVVHLHRWEWAAAATDLDRAIKLDPRYPEAQQWRGELDLVSGRFDDAAKHFQQAIALGQEAPIPLALYALALGAAGKADTSIATARLAVKLDPTLAAIRLIQGAVLLYGGQIVKGVGALEATLALEPDNEQALGLLGLAYARLGDSTRARAIAARLAKPPLRPNTYSALAKVQLGLGERNLALTSLERAASRHEPFFASEPLDSPLFAPLEGDARLGAIRKLVGF